MTVKCGYNTAKYGLFLYQMNEIAHLKYYQENYQCNLSAKYLTQDSSYYYAYVVVVSDSQNSFYFQIPYFLNITI